MTAKCCGSGLCPECQHPPEVHGIPWEAHYSVLYEHHTALITELRDLCDEIAATPPEADPFNDPMSERARDRTYRRGVARAAALSIGEQIRAVIDRHAPEETS